MKLLVLGSNGVIVTPSLLAGAMISHDISQPKEVLRTLTKSSLNEAVNNFVSLNNELHTGNGAYMESDRQIQLKTVLGDYSDYLECDCVLIVWDGIDLGVSEARQTLLGLDKAIHEVILR